MSLSAHLAMVPIVLPLLAGATMLLLGERRVALKGTIAGIVSAGLVAAAVALMIAAGQGGPIVYRLGDWPSPFGIVLVADRLSAALVLLASIVGLAATVFSTAQWQRAGPRFHALLQFLLMGVNGAFLTGDLFNLFVFFEVLLVASYGLALHGSGPARVRASLHYITINLVASLLFLIGAALIYGTTGTLNMADIGVRIAALNAADRALLNAGAAALAVAFFIKAGMWPLCLWLPGTYSAASAPAAALFALLTKVGVYVVLRTWTLFFSEVDGTGERFGAQIILVGGLLTLAFGAIGVLATQSLSRITAYSLIVSAGTLLAAIAGDSAAVTAAALFYLVASTLGASAMFLLVELLERGRAPGAEILAVTAEAYVDPDETLEAEEEVGLAIPGTLAVLGGGFMLCALVLAGLPPLAGFVGKFVLLDAVLRGGEIAAASWTFVTLLLVSGFAALVGFGRAGVRRFWATNPTVPRVRLIEIAPIAFLLALCIALTVFAGSAIRYFDAAAQGLHAPRGYIQSVLPGR